jgi:PIN domain nuclease of toxin-antitoxin system
VETKTYLDTHIVIWLYDREFKKLSETAVQIIEGSSLFVSEFVRLELKYLQEIDRLRITPEKMIRYLEDEIGLSVCTLPLAQIITEAMEMTWTRDPFDRLITANASFDNSILLTKDESILAHYPRARF